MIDPGGPACPQEKAAKINVNYGALPPGWSVKEKGECSYFVFMTELFHEFTQAGEKKNCATIMIMQPPKQYDSEAVFREKIPHKEDFYPNNFLGLGVSTTVLERNSSYVTLDSKKALLMREKVRYYSDNKNYFKEPFTSNVTGLAYYVPVKNSAIWIVGVVEQNNDLLSLGAMEEKVEEMIRKFRIGDRYVIEITSPIPSRPLYLHMKVKDTEADPKDPFLLVAHQTLQIAMHNNHGNFNYLSNQVMIMKDNVPVHGDFTSFSNDMNLLEITLDGKGEGQVEFYLDFGRIAAAKGTLGMHLPMRDNPVELPCRCEFGYKEKEQFIMLAKKEETITISYIGTVTGIQVKEPPYRVKSETVAEKLLYGECKELVVPGRKPLATYDDVQTGSDYEKQAMRTKRDRVKISPNHQKGEDFSRIDWGKETAPGIGDRVYFGDVIDMYASLMSSNGTPYLELLNGTRGKVLPLEDFKGGSVILTIAFVDGVIAEITVSEASKTGDGKEGNGSIFFGSDFNPQNITIPATFGSFITMGGVKLMFNIILPSWWTAAATGSHTAWTILSCLHYISGNDIKFIQLKSCVILEEDRANKALMLTTIEGHPVVYDSRTGPEGREVTEGKTGCFYSDRPPEIRDTGKKKREEARVLLQGTPMESRGKIRVMISVGIAAAGAIMLLGLLLMKFLVQRPFYPSPAEPSGEIDIPGSDITVNADGSSSGESSSDFTF